MQLNEESQMNNRTFDALARSIASRRIVFGGGAALLLGIAGSQQVAEARCKRAGKKCGKKKCCKGARCKRGRCRCKKNFPKWAGVCCKHRFALSAGGGTDPIPGTEFCCPPKGVCRKDSDPAHDDCCQDKETCLDGKCCCDGCRGTVICNGVCCGSDSCCNGECCPSGQVCAETSPSNLQCVDDLRECENNTGCYAGEICWGEECCTPERACLVTMGNEENVPLCCSANEYCDQQLGQCCSNGNICTTGKKVRIRV
jgi:hypothetical protein